MARGGRELDLDARAHEFGCVIAADDASSARHLQNELSKRLTKAKTGAREAMRMSLLYEIPSSVIVVCLFGVLMLIGDFGFRFGRRTRAKLTDYDGANLRTLQSSLLS